MFILNKLEQAQADRLSQPALFMSFKLYQYNYTNICFLYYNQFRFHDNLVPSGKLSHGCRSFPIVKRRET